MIDRKVTTRARLIEIAYGEGEPPSEAESRWCAYDADAWRTRAARLIHEQKEERAQRGALADAARKVMDAGLGPTLGIALEGLYVALEDYEAATADEDDED